MNARTLKTETPPAPASVASDLPAECLVFLPANELGHRIQIVRRGLGFKQSRYDHAALTEDTAQQLVRDVNRYLGVRPSQREALLAGCIYGWDSPHVDPALYEHRDAEDLLASLPTTGRPN